jgi:hypothetical protein
MLFSNKRPYEGVDDAEVSLRQVNSRRSVLTLCSSGCQENGRGSSAFHDRGHTGRPPETDPEVLGPCTKGTFMEQIFSLKIGANEVPQTESPAL